MMMRNDARSGRRRIASGRLTAQNATQAALPNVSARSSVPISSTKWSPAALSKTRSHVRTGDPGLNRRRRARPRKTKLQKVGEFSMGSQWCSVYAAGGLRFEPLLLIVVTGDLSGGRLD